MKKLVISILVLVCTFVLVRSIISSAVVDGQSMAPTLKNRQVVFVNRLATPKKNDVVVFEDPGSKGLSVKRIIATEGQEIEFRKSGEVYLDGQLLQETYLAPNTKTFSYKKYDHEKYVCGMNEFFVLGDNRMESADSREYGMVPKKNILGVIMRP